MDNLNGLDSARLFYENNCFPFPRLPVEMASNILAAKGSVFSTIQSARTPYDYHWYLDYLLHEETPDFAVFGYAGHGIYSYALHFYLSTGKFALFLQHCWNNLGGDSDRERAIVSADYQIAEQLLRDGWHDKLWPNSKSLVIMHSTLRLESKWAFYLKGDEELVWTKAPPGSDLATVVKCIKESMNG